MLMAEVCEMCFVIQTPKPFALSTEMTYSTQRVILVLVLIANFAFAGCRKNRIQPGQQTTEETYTPPPLPELISDDREPLVVQVCEYPVVFISHIPYNTETARWGGPEPDDEIIVMPSVQADLRERIETHKIKQDAVKKKASILLCGDDHATCDAVLKVISEAKRAGIEWIHFETNYRETGKVGFMLIAGGCIPLIYHDFSEDLKKAPTNASNVIKATLLANDTILWNNQPVKIEDFWEKLSDAVIRIGPENVIAVIDTDAATKYPLLRYALDQMRRGQISKVDIRLK